MILRVIQVAVGLADPLELDPQEVFEFIFAERRIADLSILPSCEIFDQFIQLGRIFQAKRIEYQITDPPGTRNDQNALV